MVLVLPWAEFFLKRRIVRTTLNGQGEVRHPDFARPAWETGDVFGRFQPAGYLRPIARIAHSTPQGRREQPELAWAYMESMLCEFPQEWPAQMVGCERCGQPTGSLCDYCDNPGCALCTVCRDDNIRCICFEDEIGHDMRGQQIAHLKIVLHEFLTPPETLTFTIIPRPESGPPNIGPTDLDFVVRSIVNLNHYEGSEEVHTP